jgi:hypothetical protein
MLRIKKFPAGLLFLLSGVLLSSCGSSAEELAAAAETAAAATSTPTLTIPFTPPIPPSATNPPLPSDTPQPTFTATPAPEIISGPKLPYSMVWPAYPPQETWEGIPIPSDAIKGQEFMGGYIYSIYQTVPGLKEFYVSTLVEMGWQLSKIGQAEDGSSIFIFQNQVNELNITVLNFGVEFKSELGVLPPRSVFLLK